MEIILKSNNIRTKKKIKRDHYWYDSVAKKMQHLRGGRMEFIYNHNERRSVPNIVDQEEWVYENNYNQIKDWVKQHESIYGIEVIHSVPRNSITININAHSFNSVVEDLYRNRIMYDYDERELKKELV